MPTIRAETLSAGGDITFQQRFGDIIQSAAPSATSLHQLPRPPEDFTGREAELAGLMEALKDGRVTISNLCGMPGVGKTALALKLAERLVPQYPDAQFYLDLRGTSPDPLTPAQAMAHVIRAYHPTARLPESEGELSGLYHSVLHGKCALLLMDNAAGKEQVAPLIPPPGCALLVTSRRHFALPGLHTLNLDTMPADDARTLLLAISARIGDCADPIARQCGYLPMALRLAGSAIAERVDLRPADYLRRLEDDRTRLDLVDASLSLSYELLTEKQQRLWCMLSVFPGMFDRWAAAAVWQMEIEAAQHALGDLVQYSLLEWNAVMVRYRLHDLARLFGGDRLGEEDRSAAQRRHAIHYVRLLQATSHSYRGGGKWAKFGLALFDLERHNIDAGQMWAATGASQDEEAALLCSAYASEGVNCLALRLSVSEWLRWLETGAEAAHKIRDLRSEAQHFVNLGTVYSERGQVEQANEYYRRALAISRELGVQKIEGASLYNLAWSHRHLGQESQAIEYLEQGLIIAREIGDRRSESFAIGQLGGRCLAMGQVDCAIGHFEQALSIAREIGDLEAESAALLHLGDAYFHLGQSDRVLGLFEEALELSRQIGDRRGECHASLGLGNAYLVRGRMGRAAVCFMQVLCILRRAVNKRLSPILFIPDRSPIFLRRVEKAIEYYGQALTAAREIGLRKLEGDILGSLGNAYCFQRRFGQAIKAYEQSLSIHREIGDRTGEGADLGNLGKVYCLLGQTKQAIKYEYEAISIARAIGDRAREADFLCYLGAAQADLGNDADASDHAQAALVILEEIESPRVAHARALLAALRRS